MHFILALLGQKWSTLCACRLPSTSGSYTQIRMDTGIFHCKILTLPKVISFFKQEGTFRTFTVHRRFLTSLTKTSLQFWWLRCTVFCIDLELQEVMGVYFLISSVSSCSQLLVMLFVFYPFRIWFWSVVTNTVYLNKWNLHWATVQRRWKGREDHTVN